MRRVAVIGAGFAGLAATKTLVESGISVQVFSTGVSASELSTGALDVLPWTNSPSGKSSRGNAQSDSAIQLVDSEVERVGLLELVSQLGFSLEPCRVATSAGIARRADGCHHGVLNLEKLRGKIVGVLEVGRPDWDAARLASELARDEWARATNTRFVPIELSGVFEDAHRKLPLPAFARLLDEDERAADWQAALRVLQGAQTTLGGLLCGPWLGTAPIEHPRGADTLLVGETLSPPDGPWGARFALTRAKQLASWEVSLEPVRVEGLSLGEDHISLSLEQESGSSRSHRVDGVVVATGGLLGGGLVPGKTLGSPLDQRTHWTSGAFEGFDPTQQGGAWLAVGSAVGVKPAAPDSRVQFAGDVLDAQAEASGTVGAACVSGQRAARRLIEAARRS